MNHPPETAEFIKKKKSPSLWVVRRENSPALWNAFSLHLDATEIKAFETKMAIVLADTDRNLWTSHLLFGKIQDPVDRNIYAHSLQASNNTAS